MHKKSKIKNKLTIIFVSFVSFVIVLLTVIQSLTKYFDLQDAVQYQLDNKLLNITDTYNLWVSDQKSFIDDISQQTEYYKLEKDFKKAEDYYEYIAGKQEGIGMLYYATKDNRVMDSAHWEPPAELVCSEREWYINAANSDESIITDPYVDANTGGLVLTIAQALRNTTDNSVDGVMAVDISMGYLVDSISTSMDDNGSYAFVVDDEMNILIHPDDQYNPSADGVFVNLNDLGDSYKGMVKAIQSGSESYTRLSIDGKGMYLCLAGEIPSTSWNMVVLYPRESLEKEFFSILLVNVILLIICVALSIVVTMGLCKKYLSPIEQVADCLDEIDRGKLSINTTSINQNSAEIQRLATALQSMSSKLNYYISDIGKVLGQLSNGDFSQKDTGVYEGDFASIKDSLNQICKSLNETFGHIITSIHETNSGASQVANNTDGISRSSIKQAEYMGEISDLLNNMNDMIDNNFSVARNAGKLSQNTINDVEKCNNEMSMLIKAMGEIKDKSEQINNVIKTIDDIAFQTNILALNAAVEAARAGASGKGFAVVADEVRNLASKSAAAAKSTADLILSSSESVERGTVIVDETAKSLVDVVTKTAEVNSMLGQIIDVSENQKSESGNIMDKIGKTSEFVNSTAASAEENAAVSEQLSGQAETLRNVVSKYKLSE